jgi:hypothetical protein
METNHDSDDKFVSPHSIDYAASTRSGIHEAFSQHWRMFIGEQ